MFFLPLTWKLLQEEGRNWRYSLAYLLAEIILAVIIAFSSFELTFSPTAFEVRYGVFATVRAIITFMTAPMHINALKMDIFLKQRERFGRLAMSYIALLLSLLPLRFLGGVLITAIVYPIVGLRSGLGNVLTFILIIELQTVAGIALSLLVSASCKSPFMADNIIPLVLSINIIFAGTLIPPPRITKGIRWMHYCAYAYFATLAYNQNEYAGRMVLGTSGFPSVDGSVFLRAKGLDEMGCWGAIGFLALHTLVYMIAAILILEGQSLMGRK